MFIFILMIYLFIRRKILFILFINDWIKNNKL